MDAWKDCKRTLLQINVTANWGSTGKIAEQIGQLAMDYGWESYIAYGRMMTPSKSKLIKIGSKWDVYVHYVMSYLFDKEGLMSRRATRKLIKEIERIKPDVIHLHNIHDHYLNYPILFEYLAKADIPVVWTQHDLWTVSGGCCYIPDDCEKWKTGCFDCKLRKGAVLDRCKRNYEQRKSLFARIKSLTLIPVSDWLGGMLKESFLNGNCIKVIHNGIDTEMFKPQESDVNKKYAIGGKKIVLCVASEWSKRNGLDDFYKLATLLPYDEYVIMLVGRFLGDTKANALEGCRMIFIDRIQNALELAQMYSAATVFVNPTFQNNYSTTNLESMACGTPVITYNTGGAPEAVDEDTDLVVVEKGDVMKLQEAVIKLSHEELGEKCRLKAEQLFEKNIIYNQYIKLFNKLSGGGNLRLNNGVKAKVLLGVAHPWSERKGLEDYITLSGFLPDYVMIVLVGLSDDQRKGLPENIVGLGPTQCTEELVMLYSMADIVLNLSKAETFGMTTVEGFACGTPGIVYNITASPELIIPETGIVVEPGDIEGVAKAVMELLSCEKPVKACRERAIKYYDKNDKYREYLELYEELMKKA